MVDLEKEAKECWDYVFSDVGWDENSRMGNQSAIQQQSMMNS